MAIIICTTPNIEGKRIVETLGLVSGNTVRARHIGTDIIAGFRDVIGGEMKGYTKMLTDAREQALQRMLEEAEKLGANAIMSFRFSTSTVKEGAAEILAYGTAVKTE